MTRGSHVTYIFLYQSKRKIHYSLTQYLKVLAIRHEFKLCHCCNLWILSSKAALLCEKASMVVIGFYISIPHRLAHALNNNHLAAAKLF